VKRTRVLYTIPELCVGGAERQLLALAKGLSRQRFQPFIAVLRPGGALEAEAKEAGIEIAVFPRGGRFDLSPVAALAKLLSRRRVRIVHSFLFLDALYARLAAGLAGTSVRIASLRGVDYAPRSIHAYLDRFLALSTTCLVTNSFWIRRQAKEWGFRRVRTETIPNGVDAARFVGKDRFALRKELEIEPSAFVVGIVGRLSPEKDHATFLRCAAEVAKACPRACFVVVGDGPERERIERATAYLGLEGVVRMTGWREDIADVMPAFNVLALTSRSESFPNVILEAMAAGVPVVATRVGGVPEIVEDGRTGLLRAAEDDRGLAREVLRLESDAALRTRIVETAYNVVREEYSIERMVRRYEGLYRELLSRS